MTGSDEGENESGGGDCKAGEVKDWLPFYFCLDGLTSLYLHETLWDLSIERPFKSSSVVFSSSCAPPPFFITVFTKGPGLFESSQIYEWVYLWATNLAFRSENSKVLWEDRVNVRHKSLQNHWILLTLSTNGVAGNIEMNDYVFQFNGWGLLIQFLDCTYWFLSQSTCLNLGNAVHTRQQSKISTPRDQ